MKRIIFSIFLVFSAVSVFAQSSKTVKNLPNYDNRLWHFGFTVGGNNMGFKIDKCDDFFAGKDVYGIEAEKHTGFHIGPISNLHLTRFVDFRMLFDLSFNQRDLVFYYAGGSDKSEKKIMQNERVSLTSTLLEFPVHFKFKAERWGNFAPYLIAGGCYKYDLSAGKSKNGEELPIKLLKHDPCVEWGGGFDFYLQYFKLSVELKYSLGFYNTLDKSLNNGYTNSINKLTSNAMIFSLHFE